MCTQRMWLRDSCSMKLIRCKPLSGSHSSDTTGRKVIAKLNVSKPPFHMVMNIWAILIDWSLLHSLTSAT